MDLKSNKNISLFRQSNLDDNVIQSSESLNSNKNQNTIRHKTLIEKLPSTGPLNIISLEEFLDKSKRDFEYLYNQEIISELTKSDFNFIRSLGSGAFGEVFLAERKADETFYAIKLIKKITVIEKEKFRYVSSEKRILHSINFPFVVHLKYFFIDSRFLYFVLPFVPGGDLFSYLLKKKQISEGDAKFYTGQLVLALEYLHHLDIIYRDVKPQNIMIDALGYLKLIDFGQCIKCYGNERAWTITGTPEYMAPEIITGKGYDCAVDWWSLGVLTFEMCAGYRPFQHKHVDKMFKLLLALKYDIPEMFSNRLKSLIKHLLVACPSKRIGNYNKKAARIKSHAWFKDIDWLNLLNRTIPAPYLPNIPEQFKFLNNMQQSKSYIH